MPQIPSPKGATGQREDAEGSSFSTRPGTTWRASLRLARVRRAGRKSARTIGRLRGRGAVSRQLPSGRRGHSGGARLALEFSAQRSSAHGSVRCSGRRCDRDSVRHNAVGMATHKNPASTRASPCPPTTGGTRWGRGTRSGATFVHGVGLNVALARSGRGSGRPPTDAAADGPPAVAGMRGRPPPKLSASARLTASKPSARVPRPGGTNLTSGEATPAAPRRRRGSCPPSRSAPRV
jgi:hypothetical protein